MDDRSFRPSGLRAAAPMIFAVARSERSLEGMRRRLCSLAEQMEYDTFYDYNSFREGSIIRVKECAHVFRNLMKKRSEDLAGFSVACAVRDIALDRPRLDLSPAFFADLLHVLLGLQGTGPGKAPADRDLEISALEGREAALERSRQLDVLWRHVEERLRRYPNGLQEEVVAYRTERRDRVLKALKGSLDQWRDWKWQLENVVRDPRLLNKVLTLTEAERSAIADAVARQVPFGITPYYLSLIDDAPSDRDRSLRAQVIPGSHYVAATAEGRRGNECAMDFMLERDTSPVDLITRRYPAIAIFKPYRTCPQICVYCQRNWELQEVLEPSAMAPDQKIEEALAWFRSHPAIHEVLVTGGDPLAMDDGAIQEVLRALAEIPTIERIRVGTRTLVTMPMRITEDLARILGGLREPGRREIVVVTHVQHPYEITRDTVEAVERIRSRGIQVYNQMVYTFYVSRRFEASALRRVLCLSGIAPYYTFNTKGKEETGSYRVPVARLLQEQKEEARLFPGMARTDEAVYNVPGMGKNYLRARQHRNILSILPDGSRVYEFHPWEKNISGTGPLETFLHTDVPILDYLKRLEEIGEKTEDYQTIWYYF